MRAATSTSTLRHATIAAACLLTVLTSAPADAQTPPTSAALTEWDIFAATGGDGTATMNVRHVVLDSVGAAGPIGSVWLTGENPVARLGRLDPTAATDNYVEWRAIADSDSGGVPVGLALNRGNGDVWVSLQGDPVFLLKIGGTDTFRRFRSTYPLVTQGVTASADHSLIAALPSPNVVGVGDGIARVPRAGAGGSVTLTWWPVGGEPQEVAIDNAGDVWFTQRSANAISRLVLADGSVTTWALPSGANPLGIHVRGGRVCAVSEGLGYARAGLVHCLDVATNVVTTYTRGASDGFDLPQRVAFNSAGEVFVTEQTGNAVSFVGAVATATAPSVLVVPLTRMVLPRTATLYVSDVTVTPSTRTAPAISSTLTGVDNGLGFVRFTVPPVAATYPFPHTAYPQPVGLSAVFNDRGQGTGAVFLAEYFDGPIVGRRAGARVGRLELSAPFSPPTLVPNPVSLRFDALVGAAAPGGQTVAITEAGGTAISWTASESASWLVLTPPTGSTPASMTVSVNHASLTPGTYTHTITLDDGAGGAEPRTIDVTLNVLEAAQMQLSPAVMTFYAVAGGASPPSQWLSVANVGSGALDWTASADQPWVQLDRTSGIAPSSIRVTINASSLASGTRTGRITVSSPTATNSPQVVDITVNVSNTGPQLAVSPASLSFTALRGTMPAPQTISVSNTGGGTIVWTAAVNESWLQVSPSSGTATPAASGTVSVVVDTAGLPRGTYNATVTIADPSASGSPKSVPVSLTVTAPTIVVSSSSLTFVAPAGAGPSSQAITVSNSGNAPLTFTPSVTSSGAWLSVSPSGPSTIAAGASLSFTMTATPGSLSAGSYAGSLVISDPAATNDPVAVSATLSVVNGPFIGVSPATLSFSTLRGRNPAAQTITLTNSGNATLNFSVPDNASWLSVTPTTGSVAPGASTTLTAVVASSALATGSYSASITIADGAAANSPQAVGVSLTVMPAATITLLPTTLTFSGARWTTCNGVESGQTLATQSLTLGNSGDAALNYTASTSGGAWLSVSPVSGGVAAGGTQALNVAVDLRGLARGTYTGLVTVSDPNSTNLNQSADVTLTVGNAAATLCVTPTSMNFGTVSRNSTTATQILQILNVGDEPMGGWNATWTASRGTVNLSSSSGTSPTTINVSVTTTNVRGNQTGTITITASGAGNSPVTVNLSWNVQ